MEASIAFEDLQIAFVMLWTAVHVIRTAHAVDQWTARVRSIGRQAASVGRWACRDAIGTDDNRVCRSVDRNALAADRENQSEDENNGERFQHLYLERWE